MSEGAVLGDPSREIAILHLAESPNDSHLMSEELKEDGLRHRVEHVNDAASLREALQKGSFDVLVVDLPFPAEIDTRFLDELSASRPELEVVFRWGRDGQWTTESEGEQLGRSVRRALASRFDRAQSAGERKQMLGKIVRQQQAYLELSKRDPREFDAAIRDLTSTIAHALDVARVSVWELSPREDVLRCIDLYDTYSETHTRGTELRSFPIYLSSLRRSLMLAAHDARSDPRTSEFRTDYLEPLGITAMLDAPIRRGGNVVGVVCHEHIGNAPRHWTVLEQCASATAASLVARAMEVRDRRRAEERAAHLERLQAIGQVASGVAHDLNNVLSVVFGNLELALGAAEQNTQLDFVRRAQDATVRVGQLVHDLLAIGRTGKLELQRLDLREFLQRLEPLLRSSAGAQTRFALKVGPGAVAVDADPNAISRVLLNLVENAHEALNGAGSITVKLSETSLERPEDELAAGRCAVVSVEDTGSGMDASTCARLFEPFFTTKKPQEGHGLGLATSFGSVRQMGGTIRVESSPGHGSRFEVLLPIASEAARAPAERVPSKAKEKS